MNGYLLRLANCVTTLILSINICFAAPVVKVVIGDHPPYSDQSAEHFGLVSRVISRAFEIEGYHVKFTFMPWGRSYVEGQKDDFDAVGYWTCSPERNEIFYCSEALYQEQTVFYFNKNNPLKSWQRLDDFKKLLIGITQGYRYSPDFLHLAKAGTLKVDAVKSDQQNFARLLKQNIDVFPMDLVPGQYLLKTQFTQAEAEQLDYHPKVLSSDTNHLLFLKRKSESSRLRDDFNQGLSKLIKSGEYQAIMEKYQD